MKIFRKLTAIDDKVNDYSKARLPEEIKEQCTDRYDKTLSKVHNALFYTIFIAPVPAYLLSNNFFAASTAFFGVMSITATLKITRMDRVWKQYRREHVKRDNLSSQQDFIFQQDEVNEA